MELPYIREEPDDKPKTIYIYEGLPVMAYKNCKDLDIVNSEEFIVVEYNTTYIVLHSLDDDVTVDVDDFHKYFVCNYCSTTHKSQGATYTGNLYILDWERIKKSRNVAYTACSRGTSLDKLTIVAGLESLEE
jgi:ATP-dependent exoDNAse (exonuclease V) alpha subunit